MKNFLDEISKFLLVKIFIINSFLFNLLLNITFTIGCISFLIFFLIVIFLREQKERFSQIMNYYFNKNFFELFSISWFINKLCGKFIIFNLLYIYFLEKFYKYLFRIPFMFMLIVFLDRLDDVKKKFFLILIFFIFICCLFIK